MRKKEVLYVTLLAIAGVTLGIVAHNIRCDCPEVDSVYMMQEPIDTLRADKAFVLVRDGNNRYWVWRPDKVSQ